MLTVVVPTRNRQNLLLRAVNSIRRASGGDVKIIIVNNRQAFCSQTETALLRSDARILVNTQCNGPAGARNTGLEAVESEFVSFLDDDDEMMPGYASAILDGFPASVSFRWVGVAIKDAGRVEYRLPPSTQEHWIGRATAALSAGVGFGLCVRTSDLRRIGGFDESFSLVEDTDLLLNMIALGFNPVPVSECFITVHDDAANRLTGLVNIPGRVIEIRALMNKHSEFLRRWPKFALQLEAGITWMRELYTVSQVEEL